MKNKLFGILSLFCLIFLLTSCRNSEIDSSQMKELNSKNVKFVDYRKIDLSKYVGSYNKGGGGVGFEFTLGRRSKNCNGFGVCSLTAVWIVIVANKENEDLPFSGVIVDRITESGKAMNADAYLELASPIDNEYDYNFYVDEDIYLLDNQYVIKAGVYEKDDNYGNYGGYRLNVEKLY